MEQLRTAFIEGTNEQYSIREDGVVFRHYTYNYNINTGKIDKILLDNKIAKQRLRSDNCNVVFVGKVYKSALSVNKLLYLHFGYTLCIKCGKKMYDIVEGKRTRTICDKCLAKNTINYYKHVIQKERIPITKEQHELNMVKSRQKWLDNNPEIYKKLVLRGNRRRTKNLPRYEVAFRLKIPTKDLSEDIYNLYVAQTKLKRLLAEKKQVSMSTFNNL